MINFVLDLEDAQGSAKANKIVQKQHTLTEFVFTASMLGNENLCNC